jgi:hypothetical protein
MGKQSTTSWKKDRQSFDNLQIYPEVTFEVAPFKEVGQYSVEFNLAISAQAFHWIRKEIGYANSARALKPGGVLDLFRISQYLFGSRAHLQANPSTPLQRLC